MIRTFFLILFASLGLQASGQLTLEGCQGKRPKTITRLPVSTN